MPAAPPTSASLSTRPPDYAAIAAAAGGALALTVKRPDEVEAAIAAGLRAVREEGRAAVIDAWLAPL